MDGSLLPPPMLGPRMHGMTPVPSHSPVSMTRSLPQVLLVAISAVILGIPFVITYLSFKAVMFVGASLLVHVKTLT